MKTFTYPPCAPYPARHIPIPAQQSRAGPHKSSECVPELNSFSEGGVQDPFTQLANSFSFDDDEFWGAFRPDDPIESPPQSVDYSAASRLRGPSHFQVRHEHEPSCPSFSNQGSTQSRSQNGSTRLLDPSLPFAFLGSNYSTTNLPEPCNVLHPGSQQDSWPLYPRDSPGTNINPPNGPHFYQGDFSFTEEDSLSLERVPSLDTNPSIGSVSFDSPPEARGFLGSLCESRIASSDSRLSSFDASATNHNVAFAGETNHGGDPDLYGLDPSSRFDTEIWPVNNAGQAAASFPFETEIPQDLGLETGQWTNTYDDQLLISGHYDRATLGGSCNVPAVSHLEKSSFFDQPTSSEDIILPLPNSKDDPFGDTQISDWMIPEPEIVWNCFVVEDGSGRAVTPPLPRHKGVRHGHLPSDKAKVTAERRRKGTTCIRCRVARVECNGQNPCQRCTKLAQSPNFNPPCIKANFAEIVKSGTCNYISQRAINHFTLDEKSRIKMLIPEAFDVHQLLGSLHNRRRSFNIRARQASGSLFVLDLANCYKFLANIDQSSKKSNKGNLRTFIDNTLVKTEPWYNCVRECDPSKNKTLLLSQWNNMPSRASYDLVPLAEGVSERPLDPEDEDDKQEIMIAAQLSRIVCRKLEIEGYAALQTEINNIRPTNSTSESRKAVVQKLGKILLSLRWRMSWWKLLGDGSNNDDIFRTRFVERVEHISKVLYFYYFALKQKIGSWNDISELRGEMSSYPDAKPVFDDFPTIQSIQGFEEWLERGQVLIREANVEQRFS